jgi:hypothetical protein
MSCTYTDNQIVDQWLECQPSPLTPSCYPRDISRLRAHTLKPLNQVPALATYWASLNHLAKLAWRQSRAPAC